MLDLGLTQTAKQLRGDLVIGARQQLTGALVDDVAGNDFFQQILVGHIQRLDAGFFNLLDVTRGDAAIFGHNHLLFLVHNINQRGLTTQATGHHFDLRIVGAQGDIGFFEEVVENRLLVHAQGTQQNGHRQFAATIDAGVDGIFGVKLKVQPRAAIGNHAR